MGLLYHFYTHIYLMLLCTIANACVFCNYKSITNYVSSFVHAYQHLFFMLLCTSLTTSFASCNCICLSTSVLNSNYMPKSNRISRSCMLYPNIAVLNL